ADLFEIVLRLRSGGGEAGLGDGRQEQGEQHHQQRQQDEQLEQREAGALVSHEVSPRDGNCFSTRSDYQSAPSTSPPARVMAARQVVRLTRELTKRALPSHMATLPPSGVLRRADTPPRPAQ